MQEFKKKIHSSGDLIFIISNEKMNDIIKAIQVLENSNILLKESLKQYVIRYFRS